MNSKHLFLILCNLVLTVVIFSSCQKSPINGNLDGMWEVMEVAPESDVNIINERLYYNFSLHVCALSYYGGGFTSGNLIYKDNQIIMDFPNAVSEESVDILKQYGINSNPVTFDIDFLSKNLLIMHDGETVVTCRKF